MTSSQDLLVTSHPAVLSLWVAHPHLRYLLAAPRLLQRGHQGQRDRVAAWSMEPFSVGAPVLRPPSACPRRSHWPEQGHMPTLAAREAGEGRRGPAGCWATVCVLLRGPVRPLL